jgi:RNA polymerase sigma-70 factor (ECF subfamily)
MECCAIAIAQGEREPNGLVSKAQAGDFSAFEALYRRDVGRTYALCLRMTADPALAEELTQETFIRAWRKLRSFRGASRFTTWLRRLAINVVLADRRGRGRKLAEQVESEHLAPALDPGAAIDLESAIAKLPVGARTIFVLHDVEGYRHDEIAGMLGVASGTSKTQLHRARKLLREALER